MRIERNDIRDWLRSRLRSLNFYCVSERMKVDDSAASSSQASSSQASSSTATGRFCCPVCDAVFSRRNGLALHSKTHTSPKKVGTLLKCDAADCEKTYNDASNLARHKRNKHSGERLSSSFWNVSRYRERFPLFLFLWIFISFLFKFYELLVIWSRFIDFVCLFVPFFLKNSTGFLRLLRRSFFVMPK